MLAVDGLAGVVRAAAAGEVKRLGRHPVIVPLVTAGAARTAIAAAAI